jgi:hypothetical protein
MKEITLVIPNEENLKEYIYFLKNKVKVPTCKSCGNFFQLGFENSEEGICDYLITQENNLLCDCEHYRIVRNLINQKEDGIVDVSAYYLVIK